MAKNVLVPPDVPMAVGIVEFRLYGCPYCGHNYGENCGVTKRTTLWKCGNCRFFCIVLPEGVQKSGFIFGDFYPERQPHPLGLEGN